MFVFLTTLNPNKEYQASIFTAPRPHVAMYVAYTYSLKVVVYALLRTLRPVGITHLVAHLERHAIQRRPQKASADVTDCGRVPS